MKSHKRVAVLAVFFVPLVGCANQHTSGVYNPQVARAKIVAALPDGWQAIAPVKDQERFTDCFPAPPTEAMTLVGPQGNYIGWTDANGETRREYLAKECLYIWIAPGDFKPRFPPMTLKNFIRPTQVYRSPDLRVWAWTEHYVADEGRMTQIMNEATAIWSPDVRLSWRSWKRDLAAALSR